MGKVKTKSLKLSMTITFLITICIIAVMSALTIFAANKLQQELLKKQYLMISSPDFRIDESTGNYVFDIDKNNVKINASIFTDKNYYNEFLELIDKYWGKHSFLSILSYEIEDKKREYMNKKIGIVLLIPIFLTNTLLGCGKMRSEY